MEIDECIQCQLFPCVDVEKRGYIIPNIEVDPDKIKLVLISESAPPNPKDYYYAGGSSSFQETTLTAFNDAGVKVNTIQDLVAMGVYFTTAVKCTKTGYGIATETVKECANLLEKELELFPKAKVYLLMGDVAIKSVNTIALRQIKNKVIPNGSTYKLRGQEYFFHDIRVFPSYLQVGPSFNIEKVKRRMIAEDISAALQLIQ
jgi:uracil-DNA glycosylase